MPTKGLKSRLGRKSCLLALVFCLAALGGARGDGKVPVSIELLLAVDVSLSVNDIEFEMQMRGLAEAFRRPEIIEQIGQHDGGIAVALLQWSGPATLEQTPPWRHLSDRASILAFADELADLPRAPLGYYTGIGRAIDHGVALIDGNGFEGRQRKIDISGDGRNNTDVEPTDARARALARGITVNGLAILNNEPDLKDYYEAFVIAGPAAFALAADDYDDFARAITWKLFRELAVFTSTLEQHQGGTALWGHNTYIETDISIVSP